MAKKAAENPDEKGDAIKVRIKDVAAPGETAPDDSAKPIIVTNRPIMKDTMVKDEKSEDGEAPQKATLSRSTREAVIQPINQEPEEAETAPAEAEGPPAEGPAKEEAPAVPPEPAATEEPPEKETPEEQDETKEPAKKMPTAEEAVAAEAAEAKKQAEHDAAIQKLVDSKKYALPINAVEKRRSKQVAILGLVLSVVLLLAWADIALDAGIVHISGVKPVTHFFSN